MNHKMEKVFLLVALVVGLVIPARTDGGDIDEILKKMDELYRADS